MYVDEGTCAFLTGSGSSGGIDHSVGTPGGGSFAAGAINKNGVDVGKVLVWITAGQEYLKSFTGSDECEKDLAKVGMNDDKVRTFASDPKLKISDVRTKNDPRYVQFMVTRQAYFATSTDTKTIWYLSDNFPQKSFTDVLGDLLHEFMHLTGLLDRPAEDALKIDPPSTNISKKFTEDCFKGIANP